MAQASCHPANLILTVGVALDGNQPPSFLAYFKSPTRGPLESFEPLQRAKRLAVPTGSTVQRHLHQPGANIRRDINICPVGCYFRVACYFRVIVDQLTQ